MSSELDDCPFCAIFSGSDPRAEIVWRTADWVAFFPTEPATPGHTLVIPQVHAADLWVLDQRTAAELMEAVLIVGRAIQHSLNPEGMNLITSAGNAAQQSVKHVHLHVVPRWSGDRIGRIWPPKRSMAERRKEGIAALIKEAIQQEMATDR